MSTNLIRIKRQVFYSFHYQRDCWRAGTVRSIGVIEGNRTATDNEWETVKGGGDPEIKRWINSQMKFRSCTVVLVGTYTAKRKWINYEIIESWNKGMGVVGIRIHGLKNKDGLISYPGDNPFDYINYGRGNIKLSSIVRCYNPSGDNSREKYDWIKKYLSAAVEEAIQIRKNH